jgi:hypothetical protein
MQGWLGSVLYFDFAIKVRLRGYASMSRVYLLLRQVLKGHVLISFFVL